MKLLFVGDSVTDMHRHRQCDGHVTSYGLGYPFLVAAYLDYCHAGEHTVLNRGDAGNRIVNLYCRVMRDIWQETPDVVTLLIGINDVWHHLLPPESDNTADPVRFDKVYRAIVEETKQKLPKARIILIPPFLLQDPSLEEIKEEMSKVTVYADIVRKIAKIYGCDLLDLQDKFDLAASKNGSRNYLYDGIHPAPAGSALIADAWIDLFEHKINPSKESN